METCSVALTFKSVDEILWCDHLSGISSALLLHGTICFTVCFSSLTLGYGKHEQTVETSTDTKDHDGV